MLGKVFGTKKAKAAINAYERNRVDVSAMEDVAGVLQDRIDEGTENLPTQGAYRLFFLVECLAYA
jgi:DNA-directed RNA polymerase I subunit RPA49